MSNRVLSRELPELSADTARTTSMFLSTRKRLEDATPVMGRTGINVDHWRRTAAGWRIAHRSVRAD
jgi:hypothetical protein